jgi:hypothetical protein
MTTTPNFGWAKPTVGTEDDTWGNTLNQALDAIDDDLKATADAKNQLGEATFDTSLKRTGQGSVLYHGDAGNVSGRITISTTDPTGTPANGDIWLKYTP